MVISGEVVTRNGALSFLIPSSQHLCAKVVLDLSENLSSRVGFLPFYNVSSQDDAQGNPSVICSVSFSIGGRPTTWLKLWSRVLTHVAVCIYTRPLVFSPVSGSQEGSAQCAGISDEASQGAAGRRLCDRSRGGPYTIPSLPDLKSWSQQ